MRRDLLTAVLAVLLAFTTGVFVHELIRVDTQAEAAGVRWTTNTLVVDGPLRPVVGGFQPITDLSSAVTPTQQANADVFIIQAENQNLRWRDDGTAPTATVGMLLYAGDMLPYHADLSAIQLIECASGGKANVMPYRY